MDLEKNMNKISYSQYSMWAQCPHRWKLNYIDKLSSFTDNIHTLFGTSMQEVIQFWVKTIYEVSAKSANELDLNTMLLAKMKKLYSEIIFKHCFCSFSSFQFWASR